MVRFRGGLWKLYQCVSQNKPVCDWEDVTVEGLHGFFLLLHKTVFFLQDLVKTIAYLLTVPELLDFPTKDIKFCWLIKYDSYLGLFLKRFEPHMMWKDHVSIYCWNRTWFHFWILWIWITVNWSIRWCFSFTRRRFWRFGIFIERRAHFIFPKFSVTWR